MQTEGAHREAPREDGKCVPSSRRGTLIPSAVSGLQRQQAAARSGGRGVWEGKPPPISVSSKRSNLRDFSLKTSHTVPAPLPAGRGRVLIRTGQKLKWRTEADGR